jgi:hypothetical protein
MSVSIYTTAPDGIETLMNFSNTNFARIMDLIGLDGVEPCGEWAVSELPDVLAKARFARESVAAMPDLDGGLVDEDLSRPGGCQMILCGLPPGYYARRLSELEQILGTALAAGAPVQWS